MILLLCPNSISPHAHIQSYPHNSLSLLHVLRLARFAISTHASLCSIQCLITWYTCHISLHARLYTTAVQNPLWLYTQICNHSYIPVYTRITITCLLRSSPSLYFWPGESANEMAELCTSDLSRSSRFSQHKCQKSAVWRISDSHRK